MELVSRGAGPIGPGVPKAVASRRPAVHDRIPLTAAIAALPAKGHASRAQARQTIMIGAGVTKPASGTSTSDSQAGTSHRFYPREERRSRSSRVVGTVATCARAGRLARRRLAGPNLFSWASSSTRRRRATALLQGRITSSTVAGVRFSRRRPAKVTDIKPAAIGTGFESSRHCLATRIGPPLPRPRRLAFNELAE